MDNMQCVLIFCIHFSPPTIHLIRSKLWCKVVAVYFYSSIISLNNVSNEIRWSLDLRWQRPDNPVGFYGLKEGVMMRSKKNPITQIDWDGFNKVDRNNQQDSIRKVSSLLAYFILCLENVS